MGFTADVVIMKRAQIPPRHFNVNLHLNFCVNVQTDDLTYVLNLFQTPRTEHSERFSIQVYISTVSSSGKISPIGILRFKTTIKPTTSIMLAETADKIKMNIQSTGMTIRV